MRAASENIPMPGMGKHLRRFANCFVVTWASMFLWRGRSGRQEEEPFRVMISTSWRFAVGFTEILRDEQVDDRH
ncbi:hypothetical protein BDW59DRAFT_152151 [Aspergillus cavernicola]|uniref:Uncharacterized protein n=1 Tax=Aspergillus cavernicola TaxID=176166 RepID=A0ABR4HSK0_9EURO